MLVSSSEFSGKKSADIASRMRLTRTGTPGMSDTSQATAYGSAQNFVKIDGLKNGKVGALTGSMNLAIDRALQRIKKVKKSKQQQLNLAWENAEKMELDGELTELELDTARFVMSGLVRRYLDDQASRGDDPWNDVLDLQDNERPYTASHPAILSSNLRIYAFLCDAVRNSVLAPYLQTPHTVRALLARDQGNVFGLYDMSTKGDSQFLGFGLYLSASYFNHDCTPNVRKERIGRAMHFIATRDIQPDEELCISYVDTKEGVEERRQELLKGWYFDCQCLRCKYELRKGP